MQPRTDTRYKQAKADVNRLFEEPCISMIRLCEILIKKPLFLGANRNVPIGLSTQTSF
jgi:hypothetical protein